MARWRWRPRRCSWRCRASATPRPPQAGAAAGGLARSQGERRAGRRALYALIAMLTNFLAAGNAAHLISILTGLGLAAAAAVGVAALWAWANSLAGWSTLRWAGGCIR